MKHVCILASAVFGPILLPVAVRAQATLEARGLSKEVDGVVRSYMAAHDAGNAAALAALIDSGPAATLAEDGQLRKGWKAIRAYLDTLLEPPRLHGGQLELRAIDVTALGPEHALAIVAFTEGLKADPKDRFPGVMTIVVRRVGRQWRAISVHKSSVPMAGE